MGSDASIRRDATAGPRDREDALRPTLDALPDGVWVLDAVRDAAGAIADFRIVFVNRRAAEHLGPRAGAAAGGLLSDVVPSGELGRVARYAEVVESGAPAEFDVRGGEGDGEGPAWGWAIAAPLGEGVVVTVRDVTARVRDEQQRAASEADYRLLAENATDMIARVTPDGRVLYVSPACREIPGVEPSEMIGRPDWEFAHPDDAALLAGVRDPDRRGQDVRTATYRGRRRGGGWVWLESTARPVRDASGAVVELQVSTRDVSERAVADAEHAALHRVSEAVAAGVDARELYRLVAAEMARVLEAAGGRVVRYLDDARAAEVMGAWRREGLPPVTAGRRLQMDPASAIGRVRETGLTAVMEVAATAPAVLPFAIAAPVRVSGRLWGAVAAAYRSPADAPPGAGERVERFAKLVSLAVADAEARARLERQATTDALTGLANHATFHAALADAFARATRYGSPLGLVMMDLDHFKALNDGLGHRAGDQALAAVGAVMRDHARRVDVVGRVGGEEFAWLMPETGTAGALEAAERLRRAIAATPVAGDARLTASLGIAERAPGDRDAEALFRRADAALFAAKRSGRDRVVAAARPRA